jgi:FAD/FMN-containing dehydrogenase
VFGELVGRLLGICGEEHVLVHRDDLYTYASDGLTHFHVVPPVAVLPGGSDEVEQILRTCH